MRAPAAHEDVRRHLLISTLILVGILVAGLAGFYCLRDDRSLFEALFLAAHTLATVGDTHRDLNTAEDVWQLILMLAGVVAALYAAGNLFAFVISGEVHRVLERRRLQNKINGLDRHFIVCGFRRMGRALCESLAARDAPFVLFEKDPQRAAGADDKNYLYVLGDAMSDQALQLAGIERAKALGACLPHDADNAFVCLTARALNSNMSIISRVEDQSTEQKLHRAGADRVICPPVISANRVAHMMMQPVVDELLELAVAGEDLEITTINISRLPGIAGHSLRDLALPSNTGMTVVAVVHADGSRQFTPPSTFELAKDDELVIFGPAGGVDRVMAQLASVVDERTKPQPG
jgi:voltage-gated potassium channel